jgi:hypothetical protein
VVSSGEATGDGMLSPVDKRGLDNRRGEWGGGFRAGDSRRGDGATPVKMRLLRFLSLALAVRLSALSDEGDSVRRAPVMAGERTLLSLSPASLSASSEPRFDGCE